MKELLLTTKAVEDLKWWLQTDKRIAIKVIELTYFFQIV